jgi:hypothetical protein
MEPTFMQMEASMLVNELKGKEMGKETCNIKTMTNIWDNG